MTAIAAPTHERRHAIAAPERSQRGTGSCAADTPCAVSRGSVATGPADGGSAVTGGSELGAAPPCAGPPVPGASALAAGRCGSTVIAASL